MPAGGAEVSRADGGAEDFEPPTFVVRGRARQGPELPIDDRHDEADLRTAVMPRRTRVIASRQAETRASNA